MPITTPPPPTAVLVGVQLPHVSDAEHDASLAELRRLVTTLGHRVVATVTQKRTALAQKTVLGQGKLAELAALTGGTGVVPSSAPTKKDKARLRRADDEEQEDAVAVAVELEPDPADADAVTAHADDPTAGASIARAGLVVVDHEISPSQLRSLELACDAMVLDRTGVIVEIFHRHAKTREAKLEVEIARLNYMAPRLREASAGADRQRGGIGGKGAGESALELDRRKVRDRIAELRGELDAIRRDSAIRRAQRSAHRRVALVGYTNAGKSSLMRALTASDVLVADKLFATLDTTVRALQPETKPRVLISDTVGFIKKLPHDLVASFRSTLDEANEASLLLYVADAADPSFRSQLEVTRTVLAEIGADAVPSRLLLNKTDRLDATERAALTAEFPEAILLSAKAPADIAALRLTILAFFEAGMVEGELLVPYAKQHLINDVHTEARVLSQAYDEAGARLRVRAHPAELTRLQRILER